MGQYQQWLLCQETERRLRTQLEALEAELADLQERAHALEQCLPRADNEVVRALQAVIPVGMPIQRENRPPSAEQELPLPRNNFVVEHGPAQPLHKSGPLPREGAQSAAHKASPIWGGPPDIPTREELVRPPLPRPEQVSPAASNAAEPQIEIPAWLHHLTISAGKDRHNGPIDQESVRTNRLVQRWLERWGRVPSSPKTAPEDAEHE